MSEFDSITASDEISRILRTAESSNAEVYCEFAPSGQPPSLVELDVRRVIGSNVVLGPRRRPGEPAKMLNAVFPSGLTVGTPVEVVFSLVDGQYAIRDIVQDVSMTTFTMSASRNLLRLQRRKDFRVSVRTDGLKFDWQSKPNDKATRSFELLDLSAGGLRLLWNPAVGGPTPALGSTLFGTLHLTARSTAAVKPEAEPPPEKTVQVELKFVKDHGPDSTTHPELGHALSFQFQNMGQEDARAVLFTCLFIHRNSYGAR